MQFSTRILLILISFVVFSSCNQPKSVHTRAVVIDTHTDTPMQLVRQGLDLGQRHSAPESRVDYPRLRDGEVDAIFFGLFTSQRERTEENIEVAYKLVHQMIDSTLISLEKNSQYAELATCANDVEVIAKKHKTAIYFGIENGFPIGKDIKRVKEFYNEGVRYITLCHSSNNDICDSSTDPVGAEFNGVSEFGEKVIAEMNSLGMLIDVSHISDSSFYDVMRLSKSPVIASHSSARAVCMHNRNMNDDMIKLLAAKGGVIQLCILGSYIKPDDTTSVNYIKKEELRKKYNNWQYENDDERKAAWAAYDSININYPEVLPTIADAVDHIDHIVSLVGSDHVGIGSDFDGGGGLADCVDVADFPKITEELIKRGYSEEDIFKIWGGNFLRVFRAVEKNASQT